MQELDEYKKLSAITKEQAESIYQALEKGKYFDYFMGFLIGIISSVVFEIAKSFFLKKNLEAVCHRVFW